MTLPAAFNYMTNEDMAICAVGQPGDMHIATLRFHRDVDAVQAPRRADHYTPSANAWRRVVRNRIAFNHDTKRGPARATLTHAVY